MIFPEFLVSQSKKLKIFCFFERDLIFKSMKPHFILLYSIIVTTALYLVENYYHPVYLLQMLQKVMSFVVVPAMLSYILRQKVGRVGTWSRESLMYGSGFWLLSVIVISGAYFLLSDMIEWEHIRNSLETRHITSNTFLLIFAYIMFGNSLVEEYFFRGVVFWNTLRISRIAAYIVSALMFSLYHMTIFGTWFSGSLLALALFGLFIGGIFFAWLYQKTWGVWGAWIFHIFADLTLLVIGYGELFF